MVKCKRKKAFWGTVLSVGAGIVGNIMSNNAAEKRANDMKKAQEEANRKALEASNRANILQTNNSLANTIDNTENEMKERLTFKCGGKSNKVGYARKYACGGRSKRK